MNLQSGEVAKPAISLRRGLPDFVVSAVPAVLYTSPGMTVLSKISARGINGFTGFVSFSLVDVPPGVEAFLSPGFSLPPGTLANSTLTVVVPEGFPPGSYPFKVQGESGNLIHTVDLLLRVRPPEPHFFIECAPTSLRLAPGEAASVTCTITSVAGFTAPVNLSVIGLPLGVTAAFNPGSVDLSLSSLQRATLTIQIGANVLPNSTPILLHVTGSGDTLTSTAFVQLTILGPSVLPPISLTLDPASLAIAPGGGGASLCTVSSLNGFSGQIDLSCTGFPDGIICDLQPHSVTPPPNGNATAQVLVRAIQGIRPGTYQGLVLGTLTSEPSVSVSNTIEVKILP